MAINAYKIMLDEIGRTKPISRKKERELFEEYETATPFRKQAIKEIIIKSNMRLVLKVALAYKNISGVDIAELVSEGKLGLLKSFNEFDWRKKVKFISYAIWDVRAKMSKYLKETTLIKIPPKKITDCRKFKRDMLSFNDMDPDMYYIYELTHLPMSFDSTPPNSDVPLFELVKDKKVENLETKHITGILRKRLLHKLSTILDDTEFTVLKGFFGFEKEQLFSLRDLGEKLNKSHERIRQIRDNGIRKLRKSNQMDEFRQIFCELANIDS